MTKNQKIVTSLKLTREKRKSQDCRTFEIKVDKSHLSRVRKEHLDSLFLEAKWLYNYQLSQEDVFDFSYKLQEVEVLNKDREREARELVNLSVQMRQSLVGRLKQNIINLSKVKKNRKGKLKFKSQINSIPLSQFGMTYDIKGKNYIRLQGLKRYIRVNGLNQLPKGCDIANATLEKKNNNYYFKIVCFTAKKEKVSTNNIIGLDFGIKDNIVASNGNKYNFNFPEPKALKKTSKKFNRSKLGSKNRYKRKLALQKQYEKLTNKKKDTKNKFISYLTTNNDLIAIQDESIKAWKDSKLKGFGRRIHHSIMGGIISDLKKKSETVMIDKYFPSTKLCPNCETKNKTSLSDRIYSCSCGYQEDRDIHSARNILREGLTIISMERRNKIFGEKKVSGFEILKSKLSSLNQEALVVG